ncbi:MAG: hypothetical protein VX874_13215 [Pseudomonadota bacterium]|nr:hypothetical protein [Pseudomonadota bacterium]
MLSSTVFKTHDAQDFQRALHESRLALAFRTTREARESTRTHIRRWIDGKFVSVPV